MKDIFLSVLDMGIAGGWVILAVLVFRMFLRRVPKKYVCLLWVPAGLRLVLPWRIASPVSLFNLIRPGAAEVTKYGTEVQKFIPGDIGMAQDPQISIGIPAADAVLSGSLPDATPAFSMNPMQFWELFGTAVWCTGMAVMLLWALVQYIRLRRQVRTAVRAEDNVYLSENVASPFILGIFRPKIYLPYGLDEGITKQVLLHERMHLRCGDPLVKFLAYGILTVYWFHPLCWIAFCLFCRDVEMRCDEAALEQTEAAEYGKALVLLASGRRFLVTGPLAFGESSVRERVKHILSWKKPALWVSVGAVVVSAVLLVVCGTDGMEDPWRQVQALQENDILEVSVICHVEGGAYHADLTKEQTEAFLAQLQKVSEEDIRAGKPDSHFVEKVMTVTVRLAGNNGQSWNFIYDGVKFFLRPVKQLFQLNEPAWYYKDTELLAYLAELEQTILQGQGILDPQSSEVSVYVSGTDTVIAPKHYEPGQWNHDYGELPVLTMTESGNLCIHVYWQPETLYVYEEYYNSLSSSATTIRRTTYTADGPHADGGYTIPVTRQNPKLDERAVYYIENGEDKYIFKVNFPIEDIKGENDDMQDPVVIPKTAAEAAALFDTLTEHMPTFNDGAKAIADCPDVYAALLHGREVTMEYILTELEREPESQKHSNMMTEVLRVMLGEEAPDESAGKILGMGYYTIWMEINQTELHNHGETYMKEKRPWGWMALNMAEES